MIMRIALWSSLLALSAMAGEKVHVSIPAAEFQAKMAEETGTLLDVRSPKEHAEGHVAGCKLINYFDEDFKEQLTRLPKEGTYYIYCRSGGRSGKTLKLMKELGFPRVYDMAGGMTGWQSAGLPVAKNP